VFVLVLSHVIGFFFRTPPTSGFLIEYLGFRIDTRHRPQLISVASLHSYTLVHPFIHDPGSYSHPCGHTSHFALHLCSSAVVLSQIVVTVSYTGKMLFVYKLFVSIRKPVVSDRIEGNSLLGV
jgi:hypothetical protein